MKIPGFLFDNDGVLIDSRELHWLAWSTFSQEYNVPINYSTFLTEVAPSSDKKQREQWADRKEEIFRSEAKGKIKLIAGVEDFLQALQKEEYPRIIASSATVKNLKMFITSTVLGKYFDDFISGEQVPHGKPAPDIFEHAALRLGLKPEECIVIEDSPSGLQAGLNAGCFVIALATTHSEQDLANYHLIFNSPKELKLTAIIEAFNQWRNK